MLFREDRALGEHTPRFMVLYVIEIIGSLRPEVRVLVLGLFSSCKASVLSRSLFHLDRLVEVETTQTDSWKWPPIPTQRFPLRGSESN
jgi:hypothetical protein